MPQPLVEILLATYNGEKYLEAQISSILDQTCRDFRILVSDDGSTDGTLGILEEFVRKVPAKISIVNINELEQGVVGNFSSLIKLSEAPYLMLCDQDDLWFPNKIQTLLDKIQASENKMSESHPVLIHSDLEVVSSDLIVLDHSLMHYSGLKPSRKSLNSLLVQNIVTGGSCIFNRSLADLVSPIPPEVLMHDWWLALIASSLGEIGYLPEPTGYYRQHHENVLGANSFGWKYIWRKFKATLSAESKNILSANIGQAKALKRMLGGELDADKSSMLDEFISLENRSYFGKRKTLLKNKFLKGTLIQNVGLFLRI